MYKKAIIFILCCMFLLACTPQKKEIIQDDKTVSNWNYDLEALVDKLETLHPDPYRTYKKELFYKDIDSIKESLPTLTEIEFKLNIVQLLAKLGDGHTRVEREFFNEKDFLKYPIKLQWFEDDLIVTHTSNQYKDLLGAKLVSINNIPLKKIISKVNTLIPHDAENWLKFRNSELMGYENVLNYLNVADNLETDKWKFKTQDNKMITTNILPINMTNEPVQFKQLPIPKFLGDPTNLIKNYDGLYGYRILNDGELLYIQYNKCVGTHFEQFSKDIHSTIQTENPNRIIFDLRENTGGNSSFMYNFILELIEQTDIENKQIDLLIGKATFSSGVLNSIDIRDLLNAKVYGEDSGEKVNSFGEVYFFTLPFSKLKLGYSTKEYIMDKNNDGPMKPDIYCTQTYSDYENGIDTCMELVLNQNPQ